MRIRIHTCDVRCLGRACFSLLEVLQKQGHVVDVNVVWFDDAAPLVDDAAIELNLIVAGMFIMSRIAKHGLPRKSKNLLWLLDPLPSDPLSGHYRKTEAFLSFAQHLDGLAAMNPLIQAVAVEHVPGLPSWILPYRISQRFIREPLPDEQRTVDLMHLAHSSPRRESAEKLLLDAGIKFSSIRGGVWQDHRDEVLRGVRVLLQVHLDEQFYFDQVRIVDAWSLGVPVLCEAVDEMERYPLKKDVHLVAGALADFPRLCAELIQDQERRRQLQANAQELLREHFVVDTMADTIAEMVDSVL